MENLEETYSGDFYVKHLSGSYRSARIYIEHLAKFHLPGSVVDIGCGRGAWLKACKEVGAKKLMGFDGDWNTQQNMIDEGIVFTACDLNRPIPIIGERCDLAISLEVAEHLEPSSAPTLVKSLTDLSDVVLFGAAFTEQGGTNHINEQPHTYWARLFAAAGYVPFDLFRPTFWGDRRVGFWYRQNTFLYVRKDSTVYDDMISKNLSPMANIEFMDCIHPELFLYPSLRRGLRMVLKTIVPTVRRRIESTLSRL